MAYTQPINNQLDYYRKKNSAIVNKAKFPNSLLYIFQLDDSPCFKIGVSQNVNRRLRDINAANPFQVRKIYNTNILTNGLAYDLENYIHTFVSESHMKNEWFEIDTNSIPFIINKIELWLHQKETNIGN